MAHGNGVEHAKADASLRERLADDGDDGLNVGAAGNLGNDARILLVQRVLARDNAGTRKYARLNNRRGSLIAGRFNAEDEDAKAPGTAGLR